MAMTIGMSSLVYRMLNNINQLDAQRSTTMTRLSTGHRINRASDDPSGLVVLAGMNSDLVAVNAAIDNNERSKAVLDTADATLMEVKALTEEVERLAVAAQDPNATTSEKAAYQASVDQHLDTIDSLVTQAEFAGTKLFTGTNAITGTSVEAKFQDIRVHQADDAVANKTFTINYTAATDALTVDGTSIGTFTTDGDEVTFSKDGYTVGFTLTDVSANITNRTIIVTASEGALFQLGTDSTSRTRLDMAAGITEAELGDYVNGYLSSVRTGGANALTVDGNSAATIAAKATRQVASAAARVGSFNKFQVGSSINALEAAKEGMTSAISQIQDADYAEETARLERQNVLMNAAVSMLGIANSQQSNVLALLQYAI